MTSPTIHCRVPDCQQTFPKVLSEVRHYSSIHSPRAVWRRKKGGLQCDFCELRLFSQNAMRRHLHTAHGLDRAESRKHLAKDAAYKAALTQAPAKRLAIAVPNGSNGHTPTTEQLFLQRLGRALTTRLRIEAEALQRAATLLGDEITNLEKQL